jgi:hypothetical protein
MAKEIFSSGFHEMLQYKWQSRRQEFKKGRKDYQKKILRKQPKQKGQQLPSSISKHHTSSISAQLRQ